MRDEEIQEIIDRAEAGVAGPDSDRARAPGRASAADGVPPEHIIHNP